MDRKNKKRKTKNEKRKTKNKKRLVDTDGDDIVERGEKPKLRGRKTPWRARRHIARGILETPCVFGLPRPRRLEMTARTLQMISESLCYFQ